MLKRQEALLKKARGLKEIMKVSENAQKQASALEEKLTELRPLMEKIDNISGGIGDPELARRKRQFDAADEKWAKKCRGEENAENH